MRHIFCQSVLVSRPGTVYFVLLFHFNLLSVKNAVLVTILWFICLLPTAAFAQTKVVNEGIKAYQNGQWAEAIAALDEGLADPAALNEKTLAEGYAHRALAKVRFLIQARLDMPENMEQLGEEYSLTAYDDFKRAQKYDPKGKLEEPIAEGLRKLKNVLLELAGDAGNQVNRIGLSPEDKARQARQLKAYAAPILEMDKYNYKAYDFLADALYAMDDFAGALKNYRLADDWFFRSAPRGGDLGIGYTYIRIAELEWRVNRDFAAAMAAIQEGHKVLAGEDKKIQNLGNRRPAEKASFQVMYEEIAAKIDKMEATIKAKAGK